MHLAWGTFESLQISLQFVAESGLSGTVFNHSDAGIPLSGFLRCKTAIDCSCLSSRSYKLKLYIFKFASNPTFAKNGFDHFR